MLLSFFHLFFSWGEGSAERVVLRDFTLADIFLTNTPKEQFLDYKFYIQN